VTELRRRFRKAGVEYVVIKNTLALRAVNEAGIDRAALRAPRASWWRSRRHFRGQGADRLREGGDSKPSVKGGLYGRSITDEARSRSSPVAAVA
jgi:large subunit ribosomal protein L10